MKAYVPYIRKKRGETSILFPDLVELTAFFNREIKSKSTRRQAANLWYVIEQPDIDASREVWLIFKTKELEALGINL